MSRQPTTHQLVMRWTEKWLDTHSLEDCVERLRADVLGLSEVERRPPRKRHANAYATPMTAEELLSCQVRARPVLAAVALRNGVSIDEMLGPSRELRFFVARAEAIWILHAGLEWCLRDSGAAVNRPHHNTAHNAVATVERRIAEDYELRDALLALVSAPAGARRAA